MEKMHMKTISANTETGGNNYTLQIGDEINASTPLMIQLQSSSSDIYVKQYYITTPGSCKVILSGSLPAGTWKFNVIYYT